MNNSLVEKFGEPPRQPKGGRSLNQLQKQQRTAPFILGYVVNEVSDDVEKSLAAIIPQGACGDTVQNHLGTVWGNGQGGKGGARLWRAGDKVRRVKENAIIALGYMTDGQVQKFCTDHNVSVDELYQRILALPSVET